MSQAILEAAAKAVARKGPGVKLAEVARAAGVSRATLYRRYRDKDALFAALEEAGHAAGPRGDVPARAVVAVERVLIDAGFSGLTFEAVARASGLSEATLYRHFEDRAGLLTAFAESKSTRRGAHALLGPGAARLPLAEALTSFARFELESLGSARGVFRLVAGAPRELARQVLERRGTERSTLAALERFLRVRMKRGELARADPRLLAAAFMSPLVTFAVFGPELLPLPALPPEALAPLLVRLFLEGAAAR